MQAEGEFTNWFVIQGGVVAAAEIHVAKLNYASEIAFFTREFPCSEPESGMC